jgi:translation elongation factor EF-4
MLPPNVMVEIFRKRKLLKNRKKVKTYEIRNVEIPQEAYGCFEIE